MEKPVRDFAQEKSQMEELLERGAWRNWRDTLTTDRRPAASRAWCASPYWSHHTPALEDWKAVIEDMSPQGLAEHHLRDMISTGSQSLPFPPIALFEAEQLFDLCGLLQDAEALAALAESLELSEGLLSLEAETAPRLCWERASAHSREGLAFSAWRWMWKGGAPKELPSPQDAATLQQGFGPRRSAALARMRQSILENLSQRRDTDAMLALADALALWKQQSFVDRTLREFAATGDPVLKQRLEAALAAQSIPPIEDAVLADQLLQLGSPALAAHVRPGAQSRTLVLALLEPQPDLAAWAAVEQQVSERTPETKRPHPLTAMAEELRKVEASKSTRSLAWLALYKIFKERPELLAPDPTNPSAILPAYELAATLRSHITAGMVAIGLIETAGPYRRDRTWWKALLRSLRPMPRQLEFGNAGDRYREALETVQHARGLSPEEKQALEAAISDGVHGWR